MRNHRFFFSLLQLHLFGGTGSSGSGSSGGGGSSSCSGLPLLSHHPLHLLTLLLGTDVATQLQGGKENRLMGTEKRL